MRTSGKILVILALIVFAILLMRNIFIRNFAEKSIGKATGFDMTLEKIDVGLIGTSFEVVGLKLFNPPDFPHREAFDIKRLYVDYNLLSLMTDEIHLQEMLIDMPHIVMVKKSDGETNFDRLKNAGKTKPAEELRQRLPDLAPRPTLEGPPSEPTEPTPEVRPKKEPRRIKIDKLIVKLGKADVLMYPRDVPNGEPQVYTLDLGVDNTYENITSVEQISILITTEVLKRAGAVFFANMIDTMANGQSRNTNNTNKAFDRRNRPGDLLKNRRNEQ